MKVFVPSLQVLRFLFLFLIASLPAWSQETSPPKRLTIHHHERIPNLRSGAAQPPPSSERSPGAPDTQPSLDAVTVSFNAFGNTFHLELESNQALIADLPSAQKRRLAAKATLYRGKLAGVAGSWVRLTRTGTKLSGMIWDGSEIYIIDSSDEVAASLASGPQSDQPYNLIYRLKDAVLTDAKCGLDPNAKPLTDFGALVDELKDLAQALPAATSELNLAIVADTQFVQANSADPEAAVVARMNVVDGIYSEQVGVHLKIAQLRALQNNGPLTSTNPGTLLDQFSDFTTAPGFTNPGLAHLFTGRDMDGGVIGIAFLSALCRPGIGVGVSETRGTGTGGALIVAHELGHNFGAPHDNQGGSPCAGTPNGFIMNPFSNGSTTFSQCSLTQMRPVIAGARCITPIDTGANADLRPVLPVNPINAAVGASFTYAVEVRNGGTAAATGASAIITVPNGLRLQSSSVTQGTCTNSATQVTCSLGSVPAAATRTITLSMQGPSTGRFTSDVTVGAANDSNSANNSVQATINISNDGGATIFESHFDTGTDSFVYADDVFRGTRQPTYASGARNATGGFSGGGLSVSLGAIDDADILNMSGGWRRTFNLPAQRGVSVSLRVRVNQTGTYESDEFSQALLAIDGRLVSNVTGRDFLLQIRGDGESGPARTSGWRQLTVDLGTLAAGSHSLTIGAFNNKKTFRNERTDVLIDDVVVTGR